MEKTRLKINPKILVIDDEEGIRKLISAILTKEGYDVILAKDGYEGLDFYQKDFFDLVITDVKMPGIDGIEVLKRMKEYDENAEVIILTGHGNLSTAISAIKEDAYDFVPKPLDNLRVLTSAVEKGIKKRSLKLENSRLLKELKQTNNELSRKNKNYFEVLSFISHELRNALSIVSGFIAILLTGSLGELNEKQSEIMDKLVENIESINHLLVNYMNLSKIEKNELTVDKTELDVFIDVLKDVVDVIELQAKRNSLDIDLSWGGIPKGVKLVADASMLRIIFLNLLFNAIKYTKAGGKIAYGYKDCGDHYLFNVYNEGAGIPLEYKDKVFDKFMRINTNAHKGKSGSGLGLFTVKKLIEAHGGKIWVETEPNAWTNFLFELQKE